MKKTMRTWITTETLLTSQESYLASVGATATKNLTLNGKPYKNYLLAANEETLFAAKTVAVAIDALYGTVTSILDESLLSVFEHSDTALIVFKNNTDGDFGTYAVNVDEESGNITLQGEGDNGAYHAALAFLKNFKGGADIAIESTSGNASNVMAQTYAAQTLLNADGTIATERTGELNVVFIGGSLTEQSGDNVRKPWSTGIVSYLQTLYPKSQVKQINSGIGGTNSEGGASRFAEHVGAHNPDIVFIDFTVNDDMNNFDEEKGQYKLENFLYQCSQLEKIPSIIYLHTPPATLPNSAVYNKWYSQVTYKQEWADHYGISTVNIYDYSYGKWEDEVKAGKTSDDYITWLDDYYGELQDEVVGQNAKYGRYDVHGGYQLYLEAIREVLKANAADMLKPYRFMPYMHPNKTDEIERTYVTKYHDDAMFDYSDGWKVYSKNDASQRTSGNLKIPVGRWEYPFFANGVHEAAAGESFTFKTDANSMIFYYMAVGTAAGSNFEVYVGDTLLGTCKASSTYIQPFISNTVDLNNPENQEITVTVRIAATSDASETSYARFGSIWFGYND